TLAKSVIQAGNQYRAEYAVGVKTEFLEERRSPIAGVSLFAVDQLEGVTTFHGEQLPDDGLPNGFLLRTEKRPVVEAAQPVKPFRPGRGLVALLQLCDFLAGIRIHHRR